MIVDAIVVASIGFAAWRGWRRGLLLSLTGLVGFIVATLAAIYSYSLFAPAFRTALKLSNGVANIAAALFVFLIVSLGAYIGGRELTKVLRLTKWGALNSAGGFLLSAGWALGWVTVVLLAISVVPVPKAIASNVEHSTIAKGIVQDAPAFTRAIARTDVRSMLSPFFAHPEERVAVKATKDFRRAPEDEGLLLNLLNQERAAHSLPLFRWDEGLARAARMHAADMYGRGYFSHDTPEGLTPGDRLRLLAVTFRLTGENIALAPTILIAHNRLMGSRTHRAHILDRHFTRVGVGVMYGRQGLLLAEEFAA